MRYSLGLDSSHLQGLTRSLMTGVIELIWNAVDADATTIEVELLRTEMGGIDGIVVRDDGHGITPAIAAEQFAKLGGSWKAQTAKSPGGRALHGRHGQGRFRPFRSGGVATWTTVAETTDGQQRTRIKIGATDLRDCDVDDPESTTAPTGTQVAIEGLGKPLSGLEGTKATDRLVASFALPIESYGFSLIYDGQPIDPTELQDDRRDYDLNVVEEQPVALTVIEWKRKMDRGLYLCNGGGAALGAIEAGIQAPGFDFTAYAKWDGFAEQASELPTIEMQSGAAKAVLDASREVLRQHFRTRLAERRQRTVTDWQSEGVYPFKQPPQGVVELAGGPVCLRVSLIWLRFRPGRAGVASTPPPQHLARHTADNGAGGDVLVNHGPGGDYRPRLNTDTRQDGAMGGNPYIVLNNNCGRRLALLDNGNVCTVEVVVGPLDDGHGANGDVAADGDFRVVGIDDGKIAQKYVIAKGKPAPRRVQGRMAV